MFLNKMCFILCAVISLVIFNEKAYAYDYSVYIEEEMISDESLIVYNGDTYIDILQFISIITDNVSLNMYNSDFAQVVCFVDENNIVAINAKTGNSYVNVNGRYLYVENKVLSREGKIYLPLRVMTKAFGGRINVCDDINKIYITLGNKVLTLGSRYYNSNTVELLAHLIYSEGGDQPLKGKIAIGNVVVNRVLSPSFPNSVSEVIYANNQFDGIKSNNFRKQPNDESYIAAKIALEYTQVVDGALYFNMTGMNSWASKAKHYITTIGDHDFFK